MTTATTQSTNDSSDTTASATLAAPHRKATQSPATYLVRLVVAELKLIVREPTVLVFVFVFPVMMSLILGGIFDADDDAFEGLPIDYYTSAYVAIAIGAIGLIMLPVQVASYREQGVLRRFRASGVESWVFPAALGVVAYVAALIGGVMVIATMAITYGISAPDDLLRTVVFGLIASASFISFGLALGWLLPSARAAQGVGMTAFFPMFLLGGGGPPPDVLNDTMSTISKWMPLSHVMRSIQEPWLGAGDALDHLGVVVVLGVVSTLVWFGLSRRSVAS